MKYNFAATMFLRHMQSVGNTTAHALTVASADDNLLRRYGSQFRSDKSKQLTAPELTRLRALVNEMANYRGGFSNHPKARTHMRGSIPAMPADPNAPAAPKPDPLIAAIDRYQTPAVKQALGRGNKVFTKQEIVDAVHGGRASVSFSNGRFNLSI